MVRRRRQPGQVHHHAVTHVPARHGAPGAARHERLTPVSDFRLAAGPVQQVDRSASSAGMRHAEPGSIRYIPAPSAVRGPGRGGSVRKRPRIGGAERQSQSYVILFALCRTLRARSSYTRRRSPAGSRVGRVGRHSRCPPGNDFDSPPTLFFGWSAAAPRLGLASLRRSSGCSGHTSRIHPPWSPGRRWPSACWPWWLWTLVGRAPRVLSLQASLLPARLAERGLFLRLMSSTSRVASRFGQPRLGGERIGEGLQRAGAHPRPEGEHRRAAAAGAPLPVARRARWRARGREALRGAGLRGDPGPARAPRHSRSAAPAPWSRWPASATW